jgi:glucan phosphoethanolaminetransferase (alkaline phosphatase superfamily)
MEQADSQTPSPAPGSSTRPMRLSDLMILIVATAIGITWLRSRTYSTAEFGLFQQRNPNSIAVAWLLGPLYQVRWWATPILAPLTLAIGTIWLIPPRPSLGRLLRRAGWVVAPLVAIVFGLQWVIVGSHSYIHNASAWWVMETSATYGQDWVGPSILFAWLALALLALVVPRPTSRSWLDSTGRGLGVAWVVVWLIGLAGPTYIVTTPVLGAAGLLPPASSPPTKSTGISLISRRPGSTAAPASSARTTGRQTPIPNTSAELRRTP